MAKNKINPVEVVPQILPDSGTYKKFPVEEPEQPKEKLLSVTTVEQFVDGGLREFFERYGYEVNWPQGQERMIPKWLIKRVLNSGGRLLTKSGEELSLE